MPNKMTFVFDEIGYWSEIKLDIIERYALAILQNSISQKNPDFTMFILMPLLAQEHIFQELREALYAEALRLL